MMNANVPTRPDYASLSASSLIVIVGVWLIISSWVLGFASNQTALWDTLLVGIAVVVLAAICLGTPGASRLSWISLLVGIWLIISPFVLDFAATSAAMSNAVIFGIVVGILALWAALASRPRIPTSMQPPPR
jgi:hypothetical protein